MTSQSPSTLSQTARRHAMMVARARRLARPHRAAEQVVTVACLVCEAAGDFYALPLARIWRVSSFQAAAPVPTQNPALIGVVGRAGVFYHVYELSRLVGSDGEGNGRHIVMLRGSPAIALRVDEAIRVAELVQLGAESTSGMRASHPAVTGFARPLQSDLFGDRTISFVDPDKLASEQAPTRAEGDQA